MATRVRRIFLFALPRSGSTLLCDALTVPKQSVLLHEPMILRKFGDGREQQICRTLREVGIEIEPSAVHCPPGKSARPWYETQVLPKLESLDFWGLKEVYLTDAERLIEIYTPDTLILLWRDPRDVALSFLELMNRSLMSFADRTTLKDEAWAMECLRSSAETLHRIARKHPHLPLQYERLMASPEERQRLLDVVGLDAFSASRITLDDEVAGNRRPELQRHPAPWSHRSVFRWKEELQGWRLAFADTCHAAMHSFLPQQDYGPPLLSETEIVSRASASIDRRLTDPSYLPEDGFDFCYARRRARHHIAPRIPRGSRVLDVGASTAALAFMGDHFDAVAVDDGNSGKKVLSKKWRDGVFPTLDAFDTATFLFSLEYVHDPLRMVSVLLRRGLRVIVSYHCVDDIAASLRTDLRFASHLARRDWQCFAETQAADAEFEWAYDGYQSLIWLDPRPTA